MSEIPQVLGGLIGAGLTAIVGYLTVVRKARTDETSIALNAWKELLTPLTQQLHEAKAEIVALRAELQERDKNHAAEVASLVIQIEELRKQLNLYTK